ncbi:MAG: LysM peptidoglycan-binding domain-containing protein [Bacillota bacterium]|nr:LysM peptidoglycan-binding domain-containing protein [Bacillota bacterium]
MALNNLQLAQAAEQMHREKWVYVRGTFGNVVTPSLLDYKCRQYSSNASQRALLDTFHGRIAVDCIGILKAALWGNMAGQGRYQAAQDRNDAMSHAAAREKGPLATIPRQVGITLWHEGHVGYVVDVSAERWQDWIFVDAFSSRVGLRRMRIGDYPRWQEWFRDTYVDYSVEYQPPEQTDDVPGGGGTIGDETHEFHATYIANRDIQGYAEPLWRGGTRPIMFEGQTFTIDRRLNKGEDYFGRDAATGIWYHIHSEEAWHVRDAENTVTISRGDTLWEIAVKELGDGRRWPEIAALNPGIDPALLRVGTVLRIPAWEMR